MIRCPECGDSRDAAPRLRDLGDVRELLRAGVRAGERVRRRSPDRRRQPGGAASRSGSPGRRVDPARGARPSSRSGERWPDGGPRRVDVTADLGDELFLRREHRFVAEPLPHLDDEPLAVEIAVEVEQVRLDPALRAAVVRVRPDRNGRAVLECRTCVDAVARASRDAARGPGSPSGIRACRPAGRPRRRPRRARTAGRASQLPRPRHRRAGHGERQTRRRRAPSRPRGPRSRAARAARDRRGASSRSGNLLRRRPPPRRSPAGTARRTPRAREPSARS